MSGEQSSPACCVTSLGLLRFSGAQHPHPSNLAPLIPTVSLECWGSASFAQGCQRPQTERGGFQKFSQEGEPSTPHCSYLGFPDHLPADLNSACCAWNAFLGSGSVGIENSWRPVSLLSRQDSEPLGRTGFVRFLPPCPLVKFSSQPCWGPRLWVRQSCGHPLRRLLSANPQVQGSLDGEGRFPQRTPLSPDVGIGPPRWFGVLPAPSQPRAVGTCPPLLGCRLWGQDAEPHPCGACGHFPPWRVVRSRDGGSDVTVVWGSQVAHPVGGSVCLPTGVRKSRFPSAPSVSRAGGAG